MWVALKRAGCCVSVFGSVNCACVPQLFQQLINRMLCPAFLGKLVCQPLCCVPFQIRTFLSKSRPRRWNHVDFWQTLQWRLLWRISGVANWSQKWISKLKKQWHWKFYLQSVWRKTRLPKISKFVSIFFHICWISAKNWLISHSSVATCLRLRHVATLPWVLRWAG